MIERICNNKKGGIINIGLDFKMYFVGQSYLKCLKLLLFIKIMVFNHIITRERVVIRLDLFQQSFINNKMYFNNKIIRRKIW